MYTSFSTLAVFGLAAVANAHMIMNTPAPFSSGLNNSPLDPSGSDYPCKQRGSATYAITGSRTAMAVGSKQPLSFTGSAVHGGGSCQISITYDKEPTASSVFKVIYSIEGGCPAAGVAGNNGNDANAASPTQYTFPIPDLPAGDATLAWTWFNKVGNREMYMNCAPVTIGAGTAKRDGNATMLMERDQATFDALPNMFLANIKSQTSCVTKESEDLAFPNPGSAVTTMGTGTPASLTDAACLSAATGGSSSGGSSSKVASSPAATSTSKVSGGASSSPVASKASSGLPGGVFATVAPSASATGSAPAATSAPASPAVSSSPKASSSPAASKTASASTPSATGTTGSGAALSGTCSTEGEWNCIGGASFQQCASGSWSAVQPMAAGMSCTAGQSSSLSMKAVGAAKRAIRFSEEHARRLARI